MEELPSRARLAPKSKDLQGIWQKRLPGFNLRSKIMPAGISGKPHLLTVAESGCRRYLFFGSRALPKLIA